MKNYKFFFFLEIHFSSSNKKQNKNKKTEKKIKQINSISQILAFKQIKVFIRKKKENCSIHIYAAKYV